MSDSTLRRLRDEALRAISEVAPGLLYEDLEIVIRSHTRGGVPVYSLLIPKEQSRPPVAGATTAPAPPLPAAREAPPGEEEDLTPCELDIILVLEKAGKRLTGEEVKGHLARWGEENAEHIHGDSTVLHALADLCRRKKLLSNRKDGHGKGYGLAEWD